MGRKQRERLQRQRLRLRIEQNGLCYYCDVEMIYDGRNRGELPTNYETFEHLKDKFDPTRTDPNHENGQRVVLACHKCNNERSAERCREYNNRRKDWTMLTQSG